MNKMCHLKGKTEGFSLIELLIVVFIMGLLASIVVVGGLGSERNSLVKADAQRLALALKLVRRESLSNNETWGVLISESSYAFALYNDELMEWYEIESGEFGPNELKANAHLRVTLEDLKHKNSDNSSAAEEGRNVSNTNAVQFNVPDIFIYASGEQTPFEIELIPNWDGKSWIVRSDGIEDATARILDQSQSIL